MVSEVQTIQSPLQGNTTGAVIGALFDKQSNGCTVAMWTSATGGLVDCAAELILAKDV